MKRGSEYREIKERLEKVNKHAHQLHYVANRIKSDMQHHELKIEMRNASREYPKLRSIERSVTTIFDILQGVDTTRHKEEVSYLLSQWSY